jgi:hypothetical protein
MDTGSNAQTQQDIDEKYLTGIGGWLIFIIIGLMVSILLNLYDLSGLLGSSLSDISLLEEAGVDAWLLYMGFVLEGLGMVLTVVFLIFIFSKNPHTRAYAFFYYGAAIVLALANFALYSMLVSSLNKAFGYTMDQDSILTLQTILQGIGWSIVWMVYWARSKRVKYTFRTAVPLQPPMGFTPPSPDAAVVNLGGNGFTYPPPGDVVSPGSNGFAYPPPGDVVSPGSNGFAYPPSAQPLSGKTPRVCERCGSRLPDEVGFCRNCGFPVSR